MKLLMIRQTVWSGGNAFAQEYGAIPAFLGP